MNKTLENMYNDVHFGKPNEHQLPAHQKYKKIGATGVKNYIEYNIKNTDKEQRFKYPPGIPQVKSGCVRFERHPRLHINKAEILRKSHEIRGAAMC